MLRRLAQHQPDSFAFTPANRAWAETQISKYPEGRQASAVIPLLWRAQEQEGWLSRPAIEYVADMLGMAYIRALEVATFYFMFHLHPVGRVAHVQVCGTTTCMVCGAEELMQVCKEKIAAEPHEVSADGAFSWEEVECLGACANAPMAQIGKDYYEDLTAERLSALLDEFRAGRVPQPGSQSGRFASEPATGLTSLTAGERAHGHNASVERALALGDTVKRIDGTEVPLTAPWRRDAAPPQAPAPVEPEVAKAHEPTPGAGRPASPAGTVVQEAEERSAATEPPATARPQGLAQPREGASDDLKLIVGVGPKLEALLHSLGFFHFDQIAAWTEAEIAWVDENLEGFRGRVTRDRWVEQARILAADGSPEDPTKLV